MYCGHARRCVCLSAAACPYTIARHGPGCNLGEWYRGCVLVVHYWADLQSVHGLRCYGNITRTRNVSEYLYSLYAFVCESNISGTAERVCAKFARTTCLVPRADEFECQGQRSRSSGTKKHCALPLPPATTVWNALAANNIKQQQREPFCRCRGVISAACV